MRKLFISILLILGAVINANAATGRTGGAVSRAGGVSARSAVTQPIARSAVSQRATATPAVVSRAATTTQKVINSGTKVATATANTAVSEECQNKYYGCMDAFCMLDNTSGGRCLCSNKNAEFDEILAEIQKLDEQSYQMATYGVEKIEMGDDAADAIAKANAAATEAMNSVNGTNGSRRKSLDLSLWNSDMSFDDDDAFDIFSTSSSVVDGKTGDALQSTASNLCAAQIPECGAEMSMLKLLYAQKIKSDCNAYENSLKQQRSSSQTKLATAERALREAALEQLRASNKYDLGQCTIEFKKCMQTTAGCGDDFAGCATVAAFDSTNARQSTSKKAKNYAIKGSATTIEITASTYDTLLAKKPLCETVTKQCVRVADQVWDTFLKEVAPAVKSAELIAEDNVRQNCIGNISQCFQKACRDNIDPNDPDGSYDMCLTRPETMLNVCRVPLNACGISEKNPEESDIWDFVVARLASMRVDSCTKEVKSCLQSDDRCGKDYTQCVGLDTDTIMRMCPYDKLVGCQQKVYGDDAIRGAAVYDEIATMVQGVMLNIDNNMLTACQNAANAAMVRVCGDTENCNGLAVDDGTGTRSLKYQVCNYTSIDDNKINWGGVCRDSLDAVSEAELITPPNCTGRTEAEKAKCGWAGKLSGVMYWGDIAYKCEEGDDKVSDCKFTTEDEYVANLTKSGHEITSEEREIISDRVYGTEMTALINAVNSAINTIESDQTVQYCMTGRRVQGMKIGDDSKDAYVYDNQGRGKGRFPNLTQQMRQTIALSALKTARENYNKRYDSEIKRMMKDQVTAAERLDKNAAVNAAAMVCDNWKSTSTLPTSKTPKVSNAGKWVAMGLIVAATIAAAVITSGASLTLTATVLGSTLSGAATPLATAGVIMTGAAAAGGVAISATASPTAVDSEQWNYKETVTTMFNETTGVCTKVRVSQNCKKVKKNICETWEDPQEVREEVTLL